MTRAGTWADLCARYRNDTFSPIIEVKANTRAGYLEAVAKIEAALSRKKVADTGYVELMQIKAAMEAEGRSADYIKRFFEQMSRVARYGKALKYPGANDFLDARSGVKVSGTPSRAVAPTRRQVRAVVDEADRRGLFAFATGYLICYELGLRAVDVRGQWLDGSGGIERNGKRWQDGLTWDMIDPDLTTMRKVISKTRRSMPDPYVWDLTLLPEIRARLRLLRNGAAVGPVITAEGSGLPYTLRGWSQCYRRIRDALGLPKELTAMDVRAGAATEARAMADPITLRNAMQHKHVATTGGYMRGRSEDANTVVRLRRAT